MRTFSCMMKVLYRTLFLPVDDDVLFFLFSSTSPSNLGAARNFAIYEREFRSYTTRRGRIVVTCPTVTIVSASTAPSPSELRGQAALLAGPHRTRVCMKGDPHTYSVNFPDFLRSNRNRLLCSAEGWQATAGDDSDDGTTKIIHYVSR